MNGAATGYLIANTGTPRAPTARAVRAYLGQFLNDPRVLDIPPLARRLLVHGVILRTRPKRSARAYQRIWTPEGSPLLVHTQALAEALSVQLGGAPVRVGMRYGQPSLPEGLRALEASGVERIVVAPLFPQDAAATRGSILSACYRWAAPRWRPPSIAALPPYFAGPRYLDACAAHYGPLLEQAGASHAVMSFHGLPVRHLARARGPGSACQLAGDCCSPLTEGNRSCYRAQCLATADALASRLGLGAGGYTACFQSRLGGGRWTGPPTFETLAGLARDGLRRVAVLCPGFAADCLETLEEIAMRGKEAFMEAGGEDYRYLPCLNAEPVWAEALAALARRA